MVRSPMTILLKALRTTVMLIILYIFEKTHQCLRRFYDVKPFYVLALWCKWSHQLHQFMFNFTLHCNSAWIIIIFLLYISSIPYIKILYSCAVKNVCINMSRRHLMDYMGAILQWYMERTIRKFKAEWHKNYCMCAFFAQSLSNHYHVNRGLLKS